MSPEANVRQQIYQKLEQVGWAVQDMKRLKLSESRGAVVRELPTDTAPMDCALFINWQPTGVQEYRKLRGFQIRSVAGCEKSLASNKSSTLVYKSMNTINMELVA